MIKEKIEWIDIEKQLPEMGKLVWLQLIDKKHLKICVLRKLNAEVYKKIKDPDFFLWRFKNGFYFLTAHVLRDYGIFRPDPYEADTWNMLRQDTTYLDVVKYWQYVIVPELKETK